MAYRHAAVCDSACTITCGARMARRCDAECMSVGPMIRGFHAD
jgi:hypothetical protein